MGLVGLVVFCSSWFARRGLVSWSGCCGCLSLSVSGLACRGLFVVAGGPEEVIPRLLLLGFLTLVAVLIARCCSCLCGDDYDRYDCYERNDTGRAIGWGLTAYNTYTLGNDAWRNRHKW